MRLLVFVEDYGGLFIVAWGFCAFNSRLSLAFIIEPKTLVER